MLRGVRTHFQPQQIMPLFHLYAAHENVSVMHGFRTAGQAAMAEAIGTVLHQNSFIAAVLFHLIRPWPLSSLQDDGIIIHLQITILDQHIRAGINVNRVRTGRFHRRGRRADRAAQILHMIAFIDMRGPEMGINQMKFRNPHVPAVGNVYQPGPLLVLVGTGRIPVPAQPEGLPGTQSVSVNGSTPAHGEAVHLIRIDQRRKIPAGLPFDPGQPQSIIADIVAALQHTALFHIQMHALPEEKGTSPIGTTGNHDHASSIFICRIDQLLNLFRMYPPIIQNPIICKHIGLAQLLQGRNPVFIKPSVNGSSVRKILFFSVHVLLRSEIPAPASFRSFPSGKEGLRIPSFSAYFIRFFPLLPRPPSSFP